MRRDVDVKARLRQLVGVEVTKSQRKGSRAGAAVAD